jgi:hypothetical protein
VSGAHALLSTLVAVARGQSSLFLLTLFTFRRSTWVPWSLAVLSPRDHPRRVDQICDVSAQPLTLAVLRHCKRPKGRSASPRRTSTVDFFPVCTDIGSPPSWLTGDRLNL